MRWLKAYPTLLKANFSSSIEYRGQMIIWILASVLPLVMMMVWISLVDTQGPINGFGSMDFVAYYLMVLLFRRLTGAWIIWDMDYDIREGMLSPQLLKPLNPIHRWLAHVLGSKPIQIVFVLPPVAIAALLLGIQYDLAPLNLVFVLIATWGALLIGFFAQAIIGSLAFWITQAVAIADVYFWISSFLSGWIIPLAMFPIGLQIALIFLPFRYSLAFPIEIILGRLTPDQLAVGFVMQYAWVVLFIAVFQWVWRRGLKLYGAVGA